MVLDNTIRGTKIHGTTILSVRRGKQVAIGGDGQVSLGATVIKQQAVKIRKLQGNRICVGFSGSTADAFALLERFEEKLKKFNGQTSKAAVELAKDWRTDRFLRRLESVLIVVDPETSLLLSGGGDVLSPDDGILGTGSGGPYAVAAARALLRHTSLSAKQIVEEALRIAADICIYTNSYITVEELEET